MDPNQPPRNLGGSEYYTDGPFNLRNPHFRRGPKTWAQKHGDRNHDNFTQMPLSSLPNSPEPESREQAVDCQIPGRRPQEGRRDMSRAKKTDNTHEPLTLFSTSTGSSLARSTRLISKLSRKPKKTMPKDASQRDGVEERNTKYRKEKKKKKKMTEQELDEELDDYHKGRTPKIAEPLNAMVSLNEKSVARSIAGGVSRTKSSHTAERRGSPIDSHPRYARMPSRHNDNNTDHALGNTIQPPTAIAPQAHAFLSQPAQNNLGGISNDFTSMSLRPNSKSRSRAPIAPLDAGARSRPIGSPFIDSGVEDISRSPELMVNSDYDILDVPIELAGSCNKAQREHEMIREESVRAGDQGSAPRHDASWEHLTHAFQRDLEPLSGQSILTPEMSAQNTQNRGSSDPPDINHDVGIVEHTLMGTEPAETGNNHIFEEKGTEVSKKSERRDPSPDNYPRKKARVGNSPSDDDFSESADNASEPEGEHLDAAEKDHTETDDDSRESEDDSRDIENKYSMTEDDDRWVSKAHLRKRMVPKKNRKQFSRLIQCQICKGVIQEEDDMRMFCQGCAIQVHSNCAEIDVATPEDLELQEWCCADCSGNESSSSPPQQRLRNDTLDSGTLPQLHTDADVPYESDAIQDTQISSSPPQKRTRHSKNRLPTRHSEGNQVEAEKSSTKLHDLKSSTTPQPSAMAVPSSVEEVAKSAIQYLEDLRGTWFLVQNNAANARGKPLTPDQVNRGYNAYGIFLEKTEQALGEFVEKIGEDPE